MFSVIRTSRPALPCGAARATTQAARLAATARGVTTVRSCATGSSRLAAVTLAACTASFKMEASAFARCSTLAARSLTRGACQCAKEAPQPSISWSQSFFNIVAGAGTFAAGIFAGIQSMDEIEKIAERVYQRHDPKHPGTLIGLVETSKMGRDPTKQADQYKEVKRTLMVIGRTGRRLTKKDLTTGGNPIRDEIRKIAKHRDKRVRIIVYDPDENPEKKEEIDQTIRVVKKWAEEGDNVELKVIKGPVPFHGDLQDEKTAYLVPIRDEVVDSVPAFIETYKAYPKGSAGAEEENANFTRIRHGFEAIWKRAKSPRIPVAPS